MLHKRYTPIFTMCFNTPLNPTPESEMASRLGPRSGIHTETAQRTHVDTKGPDAKITQQWSQTGQTYTNMALNRHRARAPQSTPEHPRAPRSALERPRAPQSAPQHPRPAPQSAAKRPRVLLPFVSLYTLYRMICSSLLSAFICLLYTSPSPRDLSTSRMPSSA